MFLNIDSLIFLYGKLSFLMFYFKAKRTIKIDVEDPFACDEIERSLTSLKFYHDLTWEAESFNAAYGPCWEPAMSQFNLG